LSSIFGLIIFLTHSFSVCVHTGGLPYGKSPVASGIESLTAHIKAGHRLPKPPNCSDEM
jgi:hypothetical protein